MKRLTSHFIALAALPVLSMACTQGSLDSGAPEETAAARSTQALSTPTSSRAAVERAAVASRTHSGSISVMQNLVDTMLLSVGAVITNGPTQMERSCKTRPMNNCELVTCDRVAPGNDQGINVGTIALKTASASVAVEPQYNNTYGTVYNYFEPNTLWNGPGDLVTTSYQLPGAAAPTVVTQAAPAMHIFVTHPFPSVVDRTLPVTMRWIGAEPTDGGKIYAVLVSEDGPVTDTGATVSRAVLTCSADPQDGRVTFSRALLGRLPPGKYFGLAQAENRVVDANGVFHDLVAPVDNSFADVVIE